MKKDLTHEYRLNHCTLGANWIVCHDGTSRAEAQATKDFVEEMR